jgi:hypothetical protein
MKVIELLKIIKGGLFIKKLKIRIIMIRKLILNYQSHKISLCKRILQRPRCKRYLTKRAASCEKKIL